MLKTGQGDQTSLGGEGSGREIPSYTEGEQLRMGVFFWLNWPSRIPAKIVF